MSADKAWITYGRLADGSFVFEKSRFTFIGTQAAAQDHADRVAAKHNENNPDNPIVRAWPQQLIGDVLPQPLEPDQQETRP